MKPYAPHIYHKAQSSRDQWLNSSVRVIEGSGRFGAKQRPFNPEAAIASYRSWVYAAASINATAVSSVPLRLFVRNRSGVNKLWNTRPATRQSKRYLYGDASGPMGMITPHKQTMRKVIEFGEDFEEVVDTHPVLELLKNVNPWFNQFDLIQLVALYLELIGNAYLHPVVNNLGVPGELWPMPSQWMFVVPDREQFIRGYVYGRDSSSQLDYAVDEVVHFRTTNPGRDGLYYGMGKPEAAWGVVKLNESNHEMDLAMADNHARPDYLMVAKAGTQGDQLDRLETKVEQKLMGSRKSGRFLSFSGDVELKPLNFPPKDLTGRDEVVEEISAVFGVPVSMLKANDPNLASSKTGYAQWRESTILPSIKLIEQKLNEKLLPMFDIQDDAVLAFDNPVPADKQFELEENTRLSSGGIRTLNEVRERIGDEPHDDPMADKLLVNGQPIGVQPNPLAGFGLSAQPSARPATEQESARIQIENRSVGLQDSDIEKIVEKVLKGLSRDEEADSVAGGVDGVDVLDSERSDVDVSGVVPKAVEADTGVGEESASLANEQDASADASEADSTQPAAKHTDLANDGCNCPSGKSFSQSELIYKVAADQDIRDDQPVTPETRLRDAVQGVFDQVSEDVMGIVGKTLKGDVRLKITSREIQRVLDRIEAMSGDLEDAIFEPLSEMLRASFERGLSDIGVTGFDITSQQVTDFIRSRTTLLAGELSGVTRARVEQVLNDGVGQGATPTELSRSIEETGAFSRARADAIARTESADAFVQGKKESWRQSGVVEGVQWLLAPNACEFCKSLAAQFNNKTVGLDDSFFKLGDVVQGTEGGTLKVNFRDIQGPPLHPNDRCDLVAVLRDVNDGN